MDGVPEAVTKEVPANCLRSKVGTFGACELPSFNPFPVCVSLSVSVVLVALLWAFKPLTVVGIEHSTKKDYLLCKSETEDRVQNH